MNPSTPFEVDTYLPYMRDVTKCESSLHELNMMWRMIESSAKMNCPVEARAILPTMAATRAGFSQLEKDLVASLAREKVSNVQAELATKKKYVTEIVVHNLYERTADIGFLATDLELCAFVAGLNENADAIRFRLRAYRRKYTVYDEIILLDVNGNILVQIDEATPLEGSLDPLIASTLACDGYVETFRYSDLRPGQREALIYSRRMHHPHTGAVVGVLCLCFAFEEEMTRIFTTHRGTARSNMLLLDAGNRVIASADPLWIPLGARLPVNHDAMPSLMMYAGREYLVRTHRSIGYQGYPGPAGWQGQVMIPIDVAFSNAHSTVLAELNAEVADGLLPHARSFCPPLFEIMGAVETIRRVVWNGQVMTAGQVGELTRLKSVLEQISETGARSNELFTQSIRELFETVLASGCTMVDAETLEQVLSLRTEQDYYVSPFAPLIMYDDQPTYVYHAATRHPDDQAHVIGGIVFNADVEFSAMLRSGLDEHEDVQAFFIDRCGTIIASTDPTRAIGTMLEIDASMLALNNGSSASCIVAHDEQYAIMGCAVSHGYREFKVSDGHNADVIAVVIESFGLMHDRALRASQAVALLENGLADAPGVEFATFFIDADLLAIAAEVVQEALPTTRVSPISMVNCPECIGVLPLEGGSSFVWVFDLGFFLSGKMTAISTTSQVVVVRHGTRTIGLLVSELHAVAKFDLAQVIDIPLVGSAGSVLVRQVIKANNGNLLIQVVGLDYLFNNLTDPVSNDNS